MRRFLVSRNKAQVGRYQLWCIQYYYYYTAPLLRCDRLVPHLQRLPSLSAVERHLPNNQYIL